MHPDYCWYVQCAIRDEPMIHLRESEDAPVEVLTIEEAHARVQATDAWLIPLTVLLEGVR